MPGFLTDYVNNLVLDGIFGGVAIAWPTTLHVGLSLTRAYKGGYFTEPSDGSYARVAVPNDLLNFPAASSGTKSNARAIRFASPTSAWGVIVSVFIADAPVGGNILAMADLPGPRTINGGDVAPTIAVNSLFFTHA